MHQNIHRDINMTNNNLFQFTFYSESKDTLIDQYIDRVIKSRSASQRLPALIFTPNPEQVMLAQSDAEFASVLQAADILIPDGVGLVIASRLLALCGKGSVIRERVSGIDLFQSIVERFPKTKSVIIGGRSGSSHVSEVTTLRVGERELPWLAAHEDVQFPTAKEEDAVVAFLKSEEPEVVFVAFGAPHQEYWSMRHRALLEKHGVRVVLVVGGAVDVLSGKLKRAPGLLRSLGLEWLFRLIQEPWRWKRQLSLIRFIGLTLRTAVSD